MQDGALVGRKGQVERVRTVLDAAHSGGGAQLLALVGDPGVGKTTLLGQAILDAEAAGAAVISVAGSAAEAALPLSGFHLLAGRTQPVWSSLPLASAATLEAVVHTGGAAPGLDQYALGVALLDALVAHAADRPLLVAIDDVGWFDPMSRDALRFACRRLTIEPVTVLVAARAADEVISDEFVTLAIDGLEGDDAVELLRRDVSAVIDEGVARRIVEGVSGNPAALAQAAARLLPDQLTGDRPLPPTLSIGAALAEAVLERAGPVGADERLALAVVAAAGEAGELVAPALRELGSSAVWLDRAVDVGLVVHARRGPAFVHPLVAAASIEVISPAERRRVHAALATACTGDVARRVVHLEGASTGPSIELGQRLWTLAEATEREAGAVEAAPLFRHAAWATPPGPDRGRRLLRAGEVFATAGDRDGALRCWRAAGEHANDERTRTKAELLELRASVWSPGMVGVIQRARTVGDRCAPSTPAWAIHAYISGMVAAIGVGDLYEVSRFVTDIDRLRPESASTTGSSIDAVLVRAKLIVGRRRAVDADVSRAVHEHVTSLAPDDPIAAESIDAVCNLPQALIWCERHDDADAVAHALADRLQAAGSVLSLAYIYAGWCELHGWRGDLERAVAMGELALDLARQTDRPALAAYTAAVLARAQAWRGAEDAVDALLAECSKTVDEMGLVPAPCTWRPPPVRSP